MIVLNTKNYLDHFQATYNTASLDHLQLYIVAFLPIGDHKQELKHLTPVKMRLTQQTHSHKNKLRLHSQANH